MIFQLHHQHTDGSTEFVSQNVFEDTDHSKFNEWREDWIKDVQTRHPLPDRCTWMICDENSNRFMGAAKEPAGT